ncbi:unnamed protein product [Moneuplotes crassus]|uniref:Uncharacterized protein n=1 Tax=Euplotes crassus TaxID=5936 RepID=A0AAD1UE30_EUPCR|nr:unnamed protein product [Moneuplotes crassus]
MQMMIRSYCHLSSHFVNFEENNVCGRKKDCLPKRRRFPQNPDLRGECCIVCDRKFYIHELFSEFREKLENIKDEEKSIKGVILCKEKNIKMIDREIEKLNDFTVTEKKLQDKIKLTRYKIDKMNEGLSIVETERKEIAKEKDRIIDEISKTESDRIRLEREKCELESQTIEINDKLEETEYKIKEMKEVLRTDYIRRKKADSFVKKQKTDMNIIETSSKGGCFNFFSSCRGPRPQQPVITEEEKKSEVVTQDCSRRESKELEESSQGSILYQYESGSFLSKEFCEDDRDNMSTDYEQKPKKKRRRRPQL